MKQLVKPSPLSYLAVCLLYLPLDVAIDPKRAGTMKHRVLSVLGVAIGGLVQHALVVQPPNENQGIELTDIRVDTDHPSTSRQAIQLHSPPPTDDVRTIQSTGERTPSRPLHSSIRSLLTQRRRPNGAQAKASRILQALDHIEHIPSSEHNAPSDARERRQISPSFWNRFGSTCTSAMRGAYQSLPTWKSGNAMVNTIGQLTAAFMTIAILRHQIYWQKQAYLLSTTQENEQMYMTERQTSIDSARAVHEGAFTPDMRHVRGEDGRVVYPSYVNEKVYHITPSLSQMSEDDYIEAVKSWQTTMSRKARKISGVPTPRKTPLSSQRKVSLREAEEAFDVIRRFRTQSFCTAQMRVPAARS